MIRITHPRPALGRQKFIGIEFRDGAATVESLDPEVEASLVQHGFTIEREALPLTVEDVEAIGKAGEKLPAKRSGKAKAEYAIVELSDGTVIGDGKSLATVPYDERTAAED